MKRKDFRAYAKKMGNLSTKLDINLGILMNFSYTKATHRVATKFKKEDVQWNVCENYRHWVWSSYSELGTNDINTSRWQNRESCHAAQVAERNNNVKSHL